MGRLNTTQVKLIMVVHLFDWLKPKIFSKSILPDAKGFIKYKQLSDIKTRTLQQWGYIGQSYIYLLNDNPQLIYAEWEVKYTDVPTDNQISKQRQLYILIKTGSQAVIDEFEGRTRSLEQQICNLRRQNENLNEEIIQMKLQRQSKQQKQIIQAQKHAKSLDLAIFFSEPLFGQTTHEKPPISYEAQINQIYSTFGELSFDIVCQIATIKRLKYVLSNYKPRILHIMCHGDSQGNMKFQNSFASKIGRVQLITPQRIQNELGDLKQLPEVVFINACHSQKIGKVFQNLNVKYVICINSQYQINDDAALCFSQKFYSQVANGKTIIDAFVEAKNKVRTDKFKCCCFHHHIKHSQTCKWAQIKKKNKEITMFHNNFHVPDAKCKCQDKPQKQKVKLHNKNCLWALKVLKQLNSNYSKNKQGIEIMEQDDLKSNELITSDGKLMICCCSSINDPKFNEHAKFKLLTTGNVSNLPFFKNDDEKMFHDFSSETIKKRNTSLLNVKYRQKYMFQFLIKQKRYNVLSIMGEAGSGRTAFALKAANYLYVRQEIKGYRLIELIDIRKNDQFIEIIQKHLSMLEKFVNQNQNQIITKNYVMILDNCDKLLAEDFNNFVNQLEQFRMKNNNLQFYLIFQNKTRNNIPLGHTLFQGTTVLRQLQDNDHVCKIIYSEIKDILIAKQSYESFQREIINIGQALKLPKILKIFCQHLRQSGQGLSIAAIKRKFIRLKQEVSQKGQWDQLLTKKIIQELDVYDQKYILRKYVNFIAQFSNGISFDDLERFSNFSQLFQKKDIPILAQNALPIKNWVKQTQHLLFDKNRDIKKNRNIEEDDSYYLAKAQGILQLKNHVRSYLIKDIKTDDSSTKFGFIAYICSLLELYFKQQFKNPMKAKGQLVLRFLQGIGIFSLNTSVEAIYDSNDRKTQSAFEGAKFNSTFKNLFDDGQHIKIKEKIEFHIDDINTLYNLNWNKKKQHTFQDEIFLCYFYNLLVYIPFFFMYVKDDRESCLRKVQKSLSILNETKIDTPKLLARNLLFQFKLKIMKAYILLKANSYTGISIFQQITKQLKQKQLSVNLQIIQYFKITSILNIEKHFFELYAFSKKDSWKDKIETIQPYINYFQTQLNIAEYLKTYNLYQMKASNFGKQVETQFNRQNQKQFVQKGIQLPINRYIILLAKIYTIIDHQHTQNQSFIEKGKWILQIISQCFDNLNSKENYLGIQAGKLNIKLLKLMKKNPLSMQKQMKKILELEQKLSKKLNITLDPTIQTLKEEIDQKVWYQTKNTIIYMKAVPIFKKIDLNKNVFNEKFNILKPEVKKQKVCRDINSISYQFEIQSSLTAKFSHTFKKIWKPEQIYDEESILIKRQSLIKQNLRNQTFKATLLVIQANALVNKQTKSVAIITENQFKEEVLLPINEQSFANFKQVDILVLLGDKMTQVAQKLNKLSNKPKVIIAINSYWSQSSAGSSCLIHQHGNDSNKYTYTGRLLQQLSRKETRLSQLQKIHQQIVQQLQLDQTNASIQILQSTQIIIDFSKKPFRQQLTQTFCPNNLEHQQYTQPFLRRLQPLHETFKYLYDIQSLWVNLYGPPSSGRTSFIKDLAQLLKQMQTFEGVFLLSGNDIQKPQYSGGEIYQYIEKESSKNKIPPAQELLKKRRQQPLLIILDDFDKIKPNEKFLNELYKSKAKVIFVSVQPQLFIMKKWNVTPQKFEMLKEEEIDMIAKKLLGDITNLAITQSLRRIKQKMHSNKKVDFSELLTLKAPHQSYSQQQNIINEFDLE